MPLKLRNLLVCSTLSLFCLISLGSCGESQQRNQMREARQACASTLDHSQMREGEQVRSSIETANTQTARQVARTRLRTEMSGWTLCQGAVLIINLATGKLERRVPMRLSRDGRELRVSFIDLSPAHIYRVQARGAKL